VALPSMKSAAAFFSSSSFDLHVSCDATRVVAVVVVVVDNDCDDDGGFLFRGPIICNQIFLFPHLLPANAASFKCVAFPSNQRQFTNISFSLFVVFSGV